MPRSTAKSKAKNCNVNVKSNSEPKKSTATKIPKNESRKEKGFKELVVETAKEAVPEVFHRKSERRRIARDIFLVFEEESNCRRKTRGSNKKQNKPKFGHLKVEDPVKPKCLLRDIKNEPRCYLSSNVLNVNTTTVPPVVPVLKCNSNLQNVCNEEKNTKTEKIKPTACKSVITNYSKKSNIIKPLKISTVDSQQSTIDKNESKIVARVNPIFLWVKQDDTRIVEVRCEDYDKRNRIRITKTSNGWRAIPRSDPTSSRVLKFYPTPLMKVKRETVQEANSNDIINRHVENKKPPVCADYPEKVVNEIDTKLNGIDTEHSPIVEKCLKSKNKKKKSRKLKKKSHTEKNPSKSDINNTAIQINNESSNLPHNTINTNEISVLPYKHIRFECKIDNDHNSTNDFTVNNHINNLEKNIKKLGDIENKINPITSSLVDVPLEIEEHTYQKESEKVASFLLCPKTGLFLSNDGISLSEYDGEVYNNENFQHDLRTNKNFYVNNSKDVDEIIALEKFNPDSKHHIPEENTESLEAKTKNLKDLLDEADLLQHCDDNANSDAELIDTLVKTSCENNLIQANEVITKASMDQINQKALHGTNEMVVQIISDVSDPPKCLSFNEAGEIEGLNGELFHSNTFMETFDKQTSSNLPPETQIALHSTTSSVVATSVSPQMPTTCENIEPILGIIDSENNSNGQSVNVIEDSPKDLSYKKREEVCPPSESRSQCAVTSSSDIIKSPQHEDPALSTSSETLKNLIMEQFMKLNAISSQHQRDPIDLGKQRHTDITNIKSIYASKSGLSNDFIETVVIEDDDDNVGDHQEEPLKKRLRLNNHKPVSQNMSKMVMIDKDPDPLTQLRLLIKNTQWKVPDPILVPKDRLSAVLASPAREIPLLITTRPELRLPEAFAYPEIIQNPNILVISMAQLEAILKNEHEKTPSTKAVVTETSQQMSEEEVSLTKHVTNFQQQHPLNHPINISSNNLNQATNNQKTNENSSILTETSVEIRKDNIKCSQTDSSLSSDINSATLAVLNQMLWLPYFGQISQDIVKSIKNPMLLQEKCSSLIPLLNSQLNGLTNLEDMYKNNINNKVLGQSTSHKDFQNIQQKLDANDDLSLFQKILQHQMQSVLQLNQLKTDSSHLTTVPIVTDNPVSLVDKHNINNTENIANSIEQRTQKLLFNSSNHSNSKVQANNCNINLVSEKSYNLRSSVAGRHSSETKQYSNNNQRRNADNKPRLTCKSLSNLLDPEHSIPASSSISTSCVQNLSTDFSELKRSTTECNINEKKVEGKEKNSRDTTIVPPIARTCSNTNVSIEPNTDFSKQKTFVDSIPESNVCNNEMSGMSTDTNIPLWHPLFGSNTKTAYSSPWQWTTVTATGE